MRRYYTPGPFITIDEQLVGFQGRSAFRQYMPSKPDKYGLKLFMAVDSETLYPLSILPYLGKQTSAATGSQGLGHYLVTEMTQRFYGSGRNVTCDKIFHIIGACQNVTAEQKNHCRDPNPEQEVHSKRICGKEKQAYWVVVVWLSSGQDDPCVLCPQTSEVSHIAVFTT